MFTLSACKKYQSMILFNSSPITKENVLNNSSEFIAGKRIYYLFITERPLKTDFVRVIILKRDEKANYEATKLVYSNDFRLNKAQTFYYTDYIILNEAGNYCMRVYAGNIMNNPLAIGDFKIKD
jgi:hypothetical protein